MKKLKRILLGYEMRRQISGGYKVVEYSQMEDGSSPRKRTIHKNLDMSTAEDKIYRLERTNKL